MKQFLLCCLLLCLAVPSASQQSICIGVDASKSMNVYGTWHSDVGEALSAVLGGRSIDQSNWEVTGALTSGKSYTAKIFRFGDVQQQQYPFFETPSEIGSSAVTAYFENLPRASNNNTNKPLAQAVAATACRTDKGQSFVIIVSDFLTDASLNDSQWSFVNEFDSDHQLFTPWILRWKPDKRLQIRAITFDQVSSRAKEGTPKPPILAGQIRLDAPRLNAQSPPSVEFKWSYAGEGAPKSYDITAVDAKRKVVFTKQSIIGNRVEYLNPAPGRLTWWVDRTTSQGAYVQSSKASFEIPSRSTGAAVWLWVILALVFGAWGVRKLWSPSRNVEDQHKVRAASAANKEEDVWKL